MITAQMTSAHSLGFVAGNLGLVPHTMRLDGLTTAQTRRALSNCEAVRAQQQQQKLRS